MTNVEINNNGRIINVECPDNWGEINVITFLKIIEKKTEILQKENILISDEVDLVSIICGISDKILYQMNLEDLQKFSNIISFINKDIEKTPKEFIEINDEIFYVKNDFSKMTLGEVASIQNLIERNKNDVIQALPELLCVFLRKKDEDDNLEEFENKFLERRFKFNQVIISDIYNIINFFFDGEKV